MNEQIRQQYELVYWVDLNTIIKANNKIYDSIEQASIDCFKLNLNFYIENKKIIPKYKCRIRIYNSDSRFNFIDPVITENIKSKIKYLHYFEIIIDKYNKMIKGIHKYNSLTIYNDEKIIENLPPIVKNAETRYKHEDLGYNRDPYISEVRDLITITCINNDSEYQGKDIENMAKMLGGFHIEKIYKNKTILNFDEKYINNPSPGSYVKELLNN